MDKTASVVIIGGGISGVATAYELAKKGLKDIVLIEKNYLSSGATGRCGAGVRMQWGTEMNCRLSKYAIERYETLNDELQYEYDIEFKQGGYLIVASTQKELDQFTKNVALQNSLGIPSRLVTPKEAKEIIPYIDTSHIIGGTFCQKDGHLNPFHTTLAYGRAAAKLGVEIQKYTTVLAIDTEGSCGCGCGCAGKGGKNGGKIVGVKTDKGYIRTNKVLVAAGGYSQQICEMVGVEVPLYSQRHQILVTEPVVPIQGPMFMGFVHNIYIQQTPHGSFIMGRGDAYEPKDLRVTSGWQFMEDMTRNCVKLLPALKDLNIVRQWAGLYNMSPDKQPIYGKISEVEGLYIAAGFSGHGFMFGPVTGVVMSEIILDQKTTVDVSMLGYDRFASGKLFIEPSVV